MGNTLEYKNKKREDIYIYIIFLFGGTIHSSAFTHFYLLFYVKSFFKQKKHKMSQHNDQGPTNIDRNLSIEEDDEHDPILAAALQLSMQQPQQTTTTTTTTTTQEDENVVKMDVDEETDNVSQNNVVENNIIK